MLSRLEKVDVRVTPLAVIEPAEPSKLYTWQRLIQLAPEPAEYLVMCLIHRISHLLLFARRGEDGKNGDSGTLFCLMRHE